MSENAVHSRKARLCSLLRSTAASFIEETSGESADAQRGSITLNHEVSCLLHLYETGAIDPVDSFNHSVPDARPGDAPLTGHHS